MASAPSQQGQDEAQRRRAALAVGGGVAAAAAAGAPAYAGAQTAQAIPAKAARVAALSAITAALVTFLTRQRQQTRTWLERRLPVAARGLAPNDVQQVIADEEVRDQAFAEKQAERMTSDLTAALAIPDPREREQRVQMILAREQRYARMRSEAMAARAFAAVDRLVLRTESPQGAYWKSDPHVKEHTAGCLIMSGGGRGRGRFWPWAVLDRVHPPRHPGCFPAGTVVAGPRPLATTARWHEGELVELRFASGRDLAVTPNHPLLTPRGWVGAGLLGEGDHILRCAAGDGPPAVRPDDEQVPAVIEDVARTVGGASRVAAVSVPLAAVDFHGDAADGGVCVVRTDGALRDILDAEAVKLAIQRAIVGADDPRVLAAQFDRTSAPFLFGGRRRMPMPASAGGEPVLLGTRPADVHQSVSGGLVADLDIGAPQRNLNRPAGHAVLVGEPPYGPTVDVVGGDTLNRQPVDWPASQRFVEAPQPSAADGPRDAEAARDARRRLADAVAVDEIVGIERRRFAGHVYNFDSGAGWYLADGVIVHNCPCRLHSYGEALKQGWLGAGDVLNVRDAISQAAGVVMEFDAEAAEGLNRELRLLELREVLVERELTTPEQFDQLLPLARR